MQLQLGIELDREHLESDQTMVANGACIGIATAIVGGENSVTPPHAAGHRRRACPAQRAGRVLDLVGIACDDDRGAQRRSGRNGKPGRRCAFARLGQDG